MTQLKYINPNRRNVEPRDGLDANLYVKAGDLERVIDQVNANTTAIEGITDGFLYQGTIDCSTNPNYPAAVQDQFWRVSVAGLIGGGAGTAVEVGDEILCIVTNAGGTQAAVGADFMIVQKNMIPCTAAVLQTGTNNTDFVTAKTLTDAGIDFEPTSIKLTQNEVVFQVTEGVKDASNVIGDGKAIPYFNVKTLKYSVGLAGISGVDYNFSSIPGHAAQTVFLGGIEIIPQRSRVIDVIVICTEDLSMGAATATVSVGSTSGGTDYINAATVDDVGEMAGLTAGSAPIAVLSNSPTGVYFTVDPDTAWNDPSMQTGSWEIYITYIDNSITAIR